MKRLSILVILVAILAAGMAWAEGPLGGYSELITKADPKDLDFLDKSSWQGPYTVIDLMGNRSNLYVGLNDGRAMELGEYDRPLFAVVQVAFTTGSSFWYYGTSSTYYDLFTTGATSPQ